MKVSITTPTLGRENNLPRLYQLFCAQTYVDRELLVLDDSERPSPFFSDLRDERVRYLYSADRLSVGHKRNLLAEASSGDVIMHFDDDDYYAPTYVESMLRQLGGGDFAKLSGWYLYSHTHEVFAYWDTTNVGVAHFRLESGKALEVISMASRPAAEVQSFAIKNLMGWGFSYVYRRQAWKAVAFADVNHGEDVRLTQAFLDAGLSVRHVVDRRGIAMAIRHTYDHSVVLPQYLLPRHLVATALGPGAEEFIAT